MRRMKHQLNNYIQPTEAHHIDAPLPQRTSEEEIVGIYGNILYPQDQERLQQKRLTDWIEACALNLDTPFPLSATELNDISLFILDKFVRGTILQYFAEQVQQGLAQGQSQEEALATAQQKTTDRVALYEQIATRVPNWEGRAQLLASQLLDSKKHLEHLSLHFHAPHLIEAPFTWDMRLDIFRQMVEKVTTLSPNSPYFLALQEVTPQALDDLKNTLKDKNLQWISFNNVSGQPTLAPGQEEVLGEATAFTSTLALSADLKVLKIELGDLPTESGSERKILGVRAQNIHNGEIYNFFTTHTDHKIQNDIYVRTAVKIHEFATHFFQDDLAHQRFVLGGDLNVFEQLGGAQYVEKLRELFTDSKDFRETDYYAPHPIAWSSFVGRLGEPFQVSIGEDGTVEPSALDQVLVGNGVELQDASREALVYNEAGDLLDYHTNTEEYIENLKTPLTFSDHLFNIVRFK